MSSEPRGDLESYVETKEVGYPIVSAPSASNKYAVKGYPTYYLVGANGEVLAGPQHSKFSDKEIETALKDVMLFPDAPKTAAFESIKRNWKKKKFLEVSRELTKVFQNEKATDAERAAAKSIKEMLDSRIESALETANKAADGPDYTATEKRLKRILKDFKGMPLEAEAKAALDEFKRDPKIKRELAAGKRYNTLVKKHSKLHKKSEREKLKKRLKALVKKYEGTHGASKAEAKLSTLSKYR